MIDLGSSHKIRGFRYLARQDNGWNGSFAKTEFFVSDTRDEFGSQPVATATFGKVKTAQAVDLDKPVAGRFVKVRVLSEVDGKHWGSAAEIGVIGVAQ